MFFNFFNLFEISCSALCHVSKAVTPFIVSFFSFIRWNYFYATTGHVMNFFKLYRSGAWFFFRQLDFGYRESVLMPDVYTTVSSRQGNVVCGTANTTYALSECWLSIGTIIILLNVFNRHFGFTKCFRSEHNTVHPSHAQLLFIVCWINILVF